MGEPIERPTAEDIDEYRDDYRDDYRDERDDYRDERDDYRDDYHDERDDYGDGYRDGRDGDSYRDDERGDQYYDERSADRPKRKGYRRDSARPRYDSGGRSSSISSIAAQMRERRELGSTVAAIALSGVDFSLHVATAIFCQVDRPLPPPPRPHPHQPHQHQHRPPAARWSTTGSTRSSGPSSPSPSLPICSPSSRMSSARPTGGSLATTTPIWSESSRKGPRSAWWS